MISVEEIADLFRGDSDSMGYAHEELIIELCSRSSRSSKPTVEWVWEIIYPGKTRDEVHLEVQGIIVSGVKLWYRRGCPRIKV